MNMTKFFHSNEWDLTITTDAISPPSLHKELESKEIHITTIRNILPKIIEKYLQGLLQKVFAKIAPRSKSGWCSASKYNYFVTKH
jgi:hypothetical protein